MTRTIICCDVCDNPLPIKKVQTPFGIIESVETFKCKEWDISRTAPDLCELCAIKLDRVVSQLKMQLKGGNGNG